MSAETRLLQWSDCDHIFQDLFASGLKLIVVGGQAVNLWVDYYARSYAQFSGPIASKDIDVLGDVPLAQRCAAVLGAKCKVVDRTKHAVPMNAIVVLGDDENALKIDFQRGSDPNPVAEIERDAVPLSTTWGEVFVMHPLHCLKSRVYNVLKIWAHGQKKYDNERGMAQLHAALAVVRCFEEDRLQTSGGPRKVINLYEKLFEFAKSPLGLDLWRAKRIDVFSSVQLHRGLPQQFLEMRYPQMQQALEASRANGS